MQKREVFSITQLRFKFIHKPQPYDIDNYRCKIQPLKGMLRPHLLIGVLFGYGAHTWEIMEYKVSTLPSNTLEYDLILKIYSYDNLLERVKDVSTIGLSNKKAFEVKQKQRNKIKAKIIKNAV